jgi:hypothetical protein
MAIMVTALRWIWLLALLIAFGVGLVALHNWAFGKDVPLWLGPISLISFCAVCVLLDWCKRRGWVKGVFWHQDQLKVLEERKQSLAAERERIIAEAAVKKESR